MTLTPTESAALEAFVLFEVAISSLEIIANGGHQCCDKADLMAEAQNLLQMTRSDAVKAHKETGMMDEINRIAAKNQEGK